MSNYFLLFICFIVEISVSAASKINDDKNIRLTSMIRWSSDLSQEKGHGITIAIIDSGASFKNELQDTIIPGWNFITDTNEVQDNDGHGTAICGIIAFLAPRTNILPLLVTHDGASTKQRVIDAIVYAITHNAKIINLSLSVTENIFNTVINNVGIKQFENTLFILAAGNTGEELREVYPWDNIIVVGATTLDYPIKLTSYSVYGDKVDIAAPAGEIDDGLTTLDAMSLNLRLFNGTSAATPVIAAAAALAWTRYPFAI